MFHFALFLENPLQPRIPPAEIYQFVFGCALHRTQKTLLIHVSKNGKTLQLGFNRRKRQQIVSFIGSSGTLSLPFLDDI
jgi:hypothetical protein